MSPYSWEHSRGLDSVGLEMMNILFEKEYLKFFSLFIIFMT